MELFYTMNMITWKRLCASEEELVPQPGAVRKSSQECESWVTRRGPGVRAAVGAGENWENIFGSLE